MAVANAQVKELLKNLMDHRNELVAKIEKDRIAIIECKAELGEVEDLRETTQDRLNKAEKLRKNYDHNIQEVIEAMENLDNAARRFSATFQSLGKMRREAR